MGSSVSFEKSPAFTDQLDGKSSLSQIGDLIPTTFPAGGFSSSDWLIKPYVERVISRENVVHIRNMQRTVQ